MLDVNFQRKVDRYVGVPICRLLSLFHRNPGKTKGSINPKRILLILLSEMGSLVLAYPAMLRLKRRYPNASFHFLLFEKNREILELLDIVPRENIFTVSNDSMTGFVRDSLGFMKRMRRAKMDLTIDLELFARISSIYSFFSGASTRVGFHPYNQEGLYRGGFINRPVMYNPYHHLSRQFINMVEAVDSAAMPVSKYPMGAEKLEVPRVRFDPPEIARLKDRFESDFPPVGGEKLVLLYPTGGILPIRAWPLEHFKALGRSLLGKGYAVGVIGLKEDKDLAREIVDHCSDPACIDLTGYTRSIRELMALFHLGALLIANDGGPAHFASMTPLPAIIFFGPETPALYGPLDEDAFCFYTPLSCSPCLTAYNHQNSPCDGDNLCLKMIRPEDVLAKALEILEA